MKDLKHPISGLLFPILMVLMFLLILFLPGKASATIGLGDQPPPVSNLKAEVTEDQPWPKLHISWLSQFPYDVIVYVKKHNPDTVNSYHVSGINETTVSIGNYEGPIDVTVQYKVEDSAPYSDPVTITADFTRPPKEPVWLLVTGIKCTGEATLSWFDYNTNETKWVIDIKDHDYRFTTLRQIVLDPQDGMVSEVIHGPLKSGWSYDFDVQAKNGGLGGPKKTVTAFIPMMPLTNLQGTYYPTNDPPAVFLTWKPDTTEGVNRQDAILIIRTNPDGTETLMENTQYEDMWLDDTVEKMKVYKYRVRRINKTQSHYNSPATDEITIDTSDGAWDFPHNNPTVNPVQVMINGGLLSMDVDPQVENGRTLVPLRSIFEGLGASVDWDGAAQRIMAKRGENKIILQIGSSQAFINGNAVDLDVAPKILGGRTLVPLRFVSEALGDEVKWDGGTRTASIVSSFKKPGLDPSNTKPQLDSSSIKPSIPGMNPAALITFSLSLEPASVTIGSTDIVEFSGTLKSSLASTGLSGKTITIYQVASGGQRTKMGTATTGSSGGFTFKLKPSGSGTFIAVYQNSSGQDLAVSSSSVVTVRPAVSSIPRVPLRKLP